LNTVYIALGSNQNNPVYHVEKGIREINHLTQTKVLKKSSLYTTKPIGPQNQPDFINAVIKISTNNEPIALLDILQEIEQQHNRKRIKRWGPRTLDLDIIIFNELEINEDRLTIPHPEMIKRDFVLIPLLEITNYDFLIPKYGKIKKFI
jgi:2-amino-4-hydroxy-6-hydroxymethyldihydropteridine diphosphokinase|tara:strand:+ start:1589 stop:2035 length:447 start_codon:yes stop_codon:yes gene_type:complete